MHRLECATRNYAWGSRTLLPRFLGTEPDGEPQAELWFGAHPADPSRLADGSTLTGLIEADTAGTLGTGVAARFGGRLPFLMKALAAAEPLSLQVHPTESRARSGHARENGAGIPVDASHRSYPDASHKPELIVAVTRFEGMAGFRDPVGSAAILRQLDLPWADAIADELTAEAAPEALRTVVAEMLDLSGPRLEELLVDVGKAARRAEEHSHQRRPPSTRTHRDRTSVEREATRVFAQTVAMAERYPADPGVLVTLLLNHVILTPGEAMFLDAGVVHAYTSGFGIEIMAASDNVVRAGLTPKHVDIPELLEIADFRPVPPPMWEAVAVEPGVLRFGPPVAEFVLYVVDGSGRALPASGPRIVLVLDGEVQVQTGRETQVLSRGAAVFVGDDEGPLAINGPGTAAIGAVPA